MGLQIRALFLAAVLVVMFVPAGYAQSSEIKEWKSTQNLPVGIADHELVAYNGYLYVLGGFSDKYLSGVYFAKINSDGSLGSWSRSADLPYASILAASALYKNFIYYMGGQEESGLASNRVVFAQVRDDGSISSWKDAKPLPAASWFHSAAIVENRVYVMGGQDQSGKSTDSVFYSEIAPDGELSTWKATTQLAVFLSEHDSISYGGRIYVIGGATPIGYTDSVRFSEVRRDGGLGSWRSAPLFPERVGRAGAATIGDFLVRIGGWDTSTERDSVYAAKINDDGTLGTWSALPSLPQGRRVLGVASYGGRLYVVGGFSGGQFLRSVLYSDPPMVAKVPSSILVRLPTSMVQVASEVEARGEISPPHGGARVTITWSRMGGDAMEKVLQTRPNGSFSDKFAPEHTGRWTVKAKWDGDSDHLGAESPAQAFTVAMAFGKFNLTWEDKVFVLTTQSNSSLSGLNFSQPLKKIQITAKGPGRSKGESNFTIPRPLLDGPFVVKSDGSEVGHSLRRNETHSFIHFTYSHSTRTIEIVGTTVIPEFPFAVIPLVVALGLMVLLSRRAHIKKSPRTDA